jgi:hypothetical protein
VASGLAPYKLAGAPEHGSSPPTAVPFEFS